MGRKLMADEPAFAAALAELEPVFVAEIGFSLRDVLADGEPVDGSRACSVSSGRDATGVDGAVAVLRGGTRCGHRAFDG